MHLALLLLSKDLLNIGKREEDKVKSKCDVQHVIALYI